MDRTCVSHRSLNIFFCVCDMCSVLKTNVSFLSSLFFFTTQMTHKNDNDKTPNRKNDNTTVTCTKIYENTQTHKEIRQGYDIYPHKQ